MRHEPDCSCEICRPSSVSDSILMGTLILAGVACAIMSGSKMVVAAVIVLLVAVAARKLCWPLFGSTRHKRGK